MAARVLAFVVTGEQRLMERLDQIRSRIPVEELRAYESEANAEQRRRDVEEIRARLAGSEA
jgi:hypothetical protein